MLMELTDYGFINSLMERHERAVITSTIFCIVSFFVCLFSSTASVPEYSLTGEFCRKHFLTGLLLRELGLALQDEQDLRHLALSTLKTLMAKHSLDARYATKVSAAVTPPPSENNSQQYMYMCVISRRNRRE